MEGNSQYKIYILSDSLGETAEKVATAALSQFEGVDFSYVKFSHIQTKARIDSILDEIAEPSKTVVAFTVILDSMREYLIEKCVSIGVRYVDVITPMLAAFAGCFERGPVNQPGIIRKLDEFYFKRIQAVEFAVKYDDGKDPRGILKADCVLIGVSRTSKTPLSMYLAHKNIKVANIPLVPEIKVPDELFEIDSKKIFCLMNDKNTLNAIRKERLKELGLGSNSSYADLARIDEELAFARDLAKKLSCTVINVAQKAIEETSNIILRQLNV